MYKTNTREITENIKIICLIAKIIPKNPVSPRGSNYENIVVKLCVTLVYLFTNIYCLYIDEGFLFFTCFIAGTAKILGGHLKNSGSMGRRQQQNRRKQTG